MVTFSVNLTDPTPKPVFKVTELVKSNISGKKLL